MKTFMSVAALKSKGLNLQNGDSVYTKFNGVKYRGISRGETANGNILVETLYDDNLVEIDFHPIEQVEILIEIKGQVKDAQ